MTTTEMILLLLLINGTMLGGFALVYFILLSPMRSEMLALRAKMTTTNAVQLPSNNGQPYYAGKIPLPGYAGKVPLPENILPDMDNLPDEAWNIGDYGEDNSTAEEVEEQMSELQVANREAQQEWKDLESLKHGKGKPIIYGGG